MDRVIVWAGIVLAIVVFIGCWDVRCATRDRRQTATTPPKKEVTVENVSQDQATAAAGSRHW